MALLFNQLPLALEQRISIESRRSGINRFAIY